MSYNMLRKLVGQYVSPTLRNKDFRKRRLVWNRNQGSFMHVLDIQPSRWNTKNEESFTINVGVLYKPAWSICWGKTCPGFIKAHDCVPEFRIGQLLANLAPKALDKWWTLKSQDDIEVVGKELQNVIREKCLPFFESCASLEQISVIITDHDDWKHPAQRMGYAIVKYCAGETEVAIAILNEMIANQKLEAWHPKLCDALTRLNVFSQGMAR